MSVPEAGPSSSSSAKRKNFWRRVFLEKTVKGAMSSRSIDAKGAKSFLLINEEGSFQTDSLNDFVTTNKLSQDGIPYAVVAIMGPAGSGKSTLLDRLFETSFSVPEKPKDGSSGRSKTTRGMWLARATAIDQCLLVMDLKGTDGVERKGDIPFEWRTALLALAVSDIVLINMWFADIGQEKGASVPLLRMVFQACMTKCKSFKNTMKTTLLITIRDSLKNTPAQKSEQVSETIRFIHKIWKSEQEKSPTNKDNLLDYFKLKVVSFPHHERERDAFTKEVIALRKSLSTLMTQSGPENDLFETVRRAAVFGTKFSVGARRIWDTIKLDRDLTLASQVGLNFDTKAEEEPAELSKGQVTTSSGVAISGSGTRKVSELKNDQETITNPPLDKDLPKKPSEFKGDRGTISTSHVSKIVENISSKFKIDEIKKSVDNRDISGLGNKLHALVEEHVSRYDEELKDFDKQTLSKSSYRAFLEEEARRSALPIYRDALSQHRDTKFTAFDNRFQNWKSSSNDFAEVRKFRRDVLMDFEKGLTDIRVEYVDHETEESKVREELLRKIDAEVFAVREEKIRALVSDEKEKMRKSAFVDFIKTTLNSATHETWSKIRDHLNEVVQGAQISFRLQLTAYDLDEATQRSLLRQLDMCARDMVKEEAMKEASESQALLRMKERFDTIFNNVNSEHTERKDLIQAMQERETLAKKAQSSALQVLSTLAVIRLDEKTSGRASDVVEQALASLFLEQRELTARSWEGIPKEQTHLSPRQCFEIWSKFLSETEISVKQARPLHVQSKDTKETKDTTSQHSQQISERVSQQISQHTQVTKTVETTVSKFQEDQEWIEIRENAKRGAVTGLDKKLGDLFHKYLPSFDPESSAVDDETTSVSYRVFLEAREIALPIYRQTLSQHSKKAVEIFKDRLTVWASKSSELIFPVAVRKYKREVLATFERSLADTRVHYIDYETEESKARETLLREIDVQVSSVRGDKISALISIEEELIQEKMESVFVDFLRASLKSEAPDTWSKVRDRLKEVMEGAQMSLRFRLALYELDEATQNSCFQQLDTCGRVIVKNQAKREASQAVQHMTERFETKFSCFDYASTKQKHPFQRIAEGGMLAEEARSLALKVLSELAIVRLNEKTFDPVEQVLATLLLRRKELTTSWWQGISSEETLLSPLQCSNVWRDFMSESERIVEQALAPMQGSLLQPDGSDYIPESGPRGKEISTVAPPGKGGTNAIGWNYIQGSGLITYEIPAFVRFAKGYHIPVQVGQTLSDGVRNNTNNTYRQSGHIQGGLSRQDESDYVQENGPRKDEIRAVVRIGKGQPITTGQVQGNSRPINEFSYLQGSGSQEANSHALATGQIQGNSRQINEFPYLQGSGSQEENIHALASSGKRPVRNDDSKNETHLSSTKWKSDAREEVSFNDMSEMEAAGYHFVLTGIPPSVPYE